MYMTSENQALKVPKDVISTRIPSIPFLMDSELDVEISSLGRTEDIAFSPSGDRLAIAGHLKHRILLFSIDRQSNSEGPLMRLSTPQTIESDAFLYPHGIFWVDESTIIVANRQGDACFVRVPSNPEKGFFQITPIHPIGLTSKGIVQSPGSVSVKHLGDGWVDVLLCNNYVHQVSQHIFILDEKVKPVADSILLQKGLDIPDGVAQSQDGHWIAISNHNEHAVRVYRNDELLDIDSEPVATLFGVNYPHGLRFTSCGKYLLVADAGLPFVHIYYSSNGDWCGEINPVASINVIDDNAFNRGQYNIQEGGPKGIDITADNKIMVVTNHEQPLAFFDLGSFFQKLDLQTTNSRPHIDAHICLTRHFRGMSRALAENQAVLEAEKIKNKQMEFKLSVIKSSYSWKMTAPFRIISRGLAE